MSRAESMHAEPIPAESIPPGAPTPPRIASSLAEEAESLFLSFRVIRRRVLGRPLGMQSLPPSYLELLNLVRRQPGIRVGEAARALRLASNTVSTLARALSGAGLLERRSDDGDHRMVRFHLTERAGSELAEWRDRRLELLAAALAELDAEDQALLGAALPALDRLVVTVRRQTNGSVSHAAPGQAPLGGGHPAASTSGPAGGGATSSKAKET